MGKCTLGNLLDDQAIQKLKNRQRDLNVKNVDLAKSIGVAPYQLDQWRARRESPTLPQLARWAELLGLKVVVGIE